MKIINSSQFLWGFFTLLSVGKRKMICITGIFFWFLFFKYVKILLLVECIERKLYNHNSSVNIFRELPMSYLFIRVTSLFINCKNVLQCVLHYKYSNTFVRRKQICKRQYSILKFCCLNLFKLLGYKSCVICFSPI